MNQQLIKALQDITASQNIIKNEPMSAHTTFKIGGTADLFVKPSSKEEIRNVVLLCKEKETPYFFIGNGSNLLVGDKGVRGVVIQVFDNMNQVIVQDNLITAEAGVLLSQLGNIAKEDILSGLEFAAGIPGTLGGAVIMNAGAYGGEMKDVIKEVEVMDTEGNFITIAGKDMEFGYRTSVAERKGYIVLSAVLELTHGEKDVIEKKMKELALARRTKQPLEYPSAGSTFKRPTGYFAGKLIMDAGLSGFAVGGAKVSEKHCGFVINSGNAKAKDVLNLIGCIKEKVKTDFNVELEAEVKMLGEF